MECFTEAECYVTVKDHKEGFPGRIKFRLINPAKTDVGVVSKHILQRITTEVKAKIKVKPMDKYSSGHRVVSFIGEQE